MAISRRRGDERLRALYEAATVILLRPGARPGQDVGGYDNPHIHQGHLSPQELLPEGVAGARFYEPDEAEAQLAERLAEVRRARGIKE